MQAERAVVDAIGQCQQPDMGQLQGLVQPVGGQIAAADRLTQGRRSAAFNYAKAVAEALPALSWVVYSGPNCGAAPFFPCVEEGPPSLCAESLVRRREQRLSEQDA